MQRLQTVLLRHETRAGSHFDLLIEQPDRSASAPAPLWAARLTTPLDAWAAAGVLHLVPLPPHRRLYLTYQGPLSHHRGHVRRLAAGHAEPRLWTTSRIVLDVALGEFVGRLDLRRQSPVLWRAAVGQPLSA